MDLTLPLKSFVVTYIGHRGCMGAENLFPDVHIVKAPDLGAACNQLAADGGFIVTSENRRSHVGPPVFVPFHAVIAVHEHTR